MVKRRSNDLISAVTITAGTWEFFEHAEYRGERRRLRPGRYATMVDH